MSGIAITMPLCCITSKRWLEGTSALPFSEAPVVPVSAPESTNKNIVTANVLTYLAGA